MTIKRPCKHAYRTMVIARMTLKHIYNSYYIPNDKKMLFKMKDFRSNSIKLKW